MKDDFILLGKFLLNATFIYRLVSHSVLVDTCLCDSTDCTFVRRKVRVLWRRCWTTYKLSWVHGVGFLIIINIILCKRQRNLISRRKKRKGRTTVAEEAISVYSQIIIIHAIICENFSQGLFFKFLTSNKNIMLTCTDLIKRCLSKEYVQFHEFLCTYVRLSWQFESEKEKQETQKTKWMALFKLQ